MTTRARFSCLAGALLAASWLSAAEAQLDLSTVRGQVVDDKGQPLPAVAVELEFKGESRQKIVKKATTDKKGSYIWSGLKPGQWQLSFSKDGFKTVRTETYLSGGGVSEIPPVAMAPAAPAPAGAVAIPAPAAPGADSAAQAERAKAAGETYQKAVAALRAGQADEAEALFKQVLAEFPNLAEAHHNLAYLYGRRNDIAGAEAAYRKAIELQPQSVEPYIALSMLLGDNKRGEDALKLLQEQAERFAGDAKFQFAIGAAAFNLGQAAEAQAAFTKVAELDPAQAEVQFYLGSLALQRNEVPAAVQHLEKYVAAAPPGAANLAPAKALLETLKKRR
jgi:Flp pilus assembly protein TadD